MKAYIYIKGSMLVLLNNSKSTGCQQKICADQMLLVVEVTLTTQT